MAAFGSQRSTFKSILLLNVMKREQTDPVIPKRREGTKDDPLERPHAKKGPSKFCCHVPRASLLQGAIRQQEISTVIGIWGVVELYDSESIQYVVEEF